MDISQVKAAINSNTVAIYSSACSFTHGVIDPIEALGQVALNKGFSCC
jgi:sphinganine-1-phosphate aldolase